MPVEQVNESRNNVIATIRRVAQSQQADFDYLLTQAKVESGLNPAARAQTSSATGLYQFTAGTWLNIVGRHGDKAGLDSHAQALRSGNLSGPDRQKLLALRNEPEVATTMAAHLAADNARALAASGINNIGPTELYLAHFLGAGGAKTFLDGLSKSPSQAAANALPAAASSNTPVFYEGTRARSFQEIYDRFAQKFAGAGTGTMTAALAASVSATSDAIPTPKMPERLQSILQEQPAAADPQTMRIAAAVRSALSPAQNAQPQAANANAQSGAPVSEEAMTQYLKNFELVDHSKGMASPGAQSLRDASQASDMQNMYEANSVRTSNQFALGANLVLKAVNPAEDQKGPI
jgi:hypothetical protein